MAVLNETGQLLGSQCLELLLDLAEDELDGIVVWRVCQIVDILDAELSHKFLGLLGCMDRKIIHEETNLHALIQNGQLFEVLLEFLKVDGILIDVK